MAQFRNRAWCTKGNAQDIFETVAEISKISYKYEENNYRRTLVHIDIKCKQLAELVQKPWISEVKLFNTVPNYYAHHVHEFVDDPQTYVRKMKRSFQLMVKRSKNVSSPNTVFFSSEMIVMKCKIKDVNRFCIGSINKVISDNAF